MFLPVSLYQMNNMHISAASGLDVVKDADRVAKAGTLAHQLVCLCSFVGGDVKSGTELATQPRYSEHIYFGALINLPTDKDAFYLYSVLACYDMKSLVTIAGDVIYVHGSLKDWFQVYAALKADAASRSMNDLAGLIQQFFKLQGVA